MVKLNATPMSGATLNVPFSIFVPLYAKLSIKRIFDGISRNKYTGTEIWKILMSLVRQNKITMLIVLY